MACGRVGCIQRTNNYKLFRTLDVYVTGTTVVLVVPKAILQNLEDFYLVICQSIPEVANTDTVQIQFGFSGATAAEVFTVYTNDNVTLVPNTLKCRTLYRMIADNMAGGATTPGIVLSPRCCNSKAILKQAAAPAGSEGK